MLIYRLLLVSCFLSLICLTPSSFAASNQQVITEIQTLNAKEDYQAAFNLGHQNLENLAGNPEFDLAFGTAAINVGEEDHAIFAFERVLVYQKDMQAARQNLAQTHIKKGNFTAANKHLGKTNTFNTLAAAASLQAINPSLSYKQLSYLNHKLANRKAMFIANLGVGVGAVTSPRQVVSTYNLPIHTSYSSYPDTSTDTYNKYTAGLGLFFAFTSRFGMQTSVQADVINPHSYGLAEPTTKAGKAEVDFYLLGETWALSLPIQLAQQERSYKDYDFALDKETLETFSLSLKAYKKLAKNFALLFQVSLLASDYEAALLTAADEFTPRGRQSDNRVGYFNLDWVFQATPSWQIVTSFAGSTKGETDLKGCGWGCGIAATSYLHPSLNRAKVFKLQNTWRLSQEAKFNLGASLQSAQLTRFNFQTISPPQEESATFNLATINLGLEVTNRNLWQTQVNAEHSFTRTTASELPNSRLTHLSLTIKKLW